MLGSGLAFPLQVDRRGGIALARDEQDIDQAIQLILGTAPGERPMRPEFGCGVHDFVFDSIDANTVGRIEDAIRTALERWEPRIEVETVEFDLSQSGSGLLTIDIGFKVRATNTERNLVYPFFVIPGEEMDGGSRRSSWTTAGSRISSPRPGPASRAPVRSGPSTTSRIPAS